VKGQEGEALIIAPGASPKGVLSLTKAIEVVYEGGVFRPLGRVELPEGTRGVVVIEEDIDAVVAEVDKLIEEKGIAIEEDPLEALIRGRR